VARMGQKRNAYKRLVGKPEVKRPPGRPRRRQVDKYYGSGQGPVEGSCEHGNELSGSIKCCEVLE
jgi:hypothetical protein